MVSAEADSVQVCNIEILRLHDGDVGVRLGRWRESPVERGVLFAVSAFSVDDHAVFQVGCKDDFHA